MSKILVTGFEPFGGDSFNPSSWILDQIKQDPELSKNCDTLLLPVVFDESYKPVLGALRDRSEPYKAWIGFGLAGGRTRVGLERVALNWKEADIADNSGLKVQPGPLVIGEESAYFSNAPLEPIRRVLVENQIPAEISFSAGAYVCNSLYYHVLRSLPVSMWGLFVHVPYLESQVLQNEKLQGKPFLDQVILWRAAQLILRFGKSF